MFGKTSETTIAKKQGAILKFDEMGKIDRKDGTAHKACCFRDKHINEPFDNWQRCTYNNCPFLKGGK